MNAAIPMMRFANLIVLLGLGGGAGLPLGVPPAPEDPLMAKVAPEECLFYTTWSGVAEPDAESTNQTEQLLAEPEIRHLIAEVERLIKKGLQEEAARGDPQAAQLVEDATAWVKTLLTHPTAIFVSKVQPVPKPEVWAGAVVAVGDDAPQLKGKLEMYQALVLKDAVQQVEIGGANWHRITLDPNTPAITWGVRGRYLIVGVGEGSIEGILTRAHTDPPEWLTSIRKQLPVERISTVTYLNVKGLLDTLLPLAGPEQAKITAALQALGLANVTSLASVTGLDGEGFVSRNLLGVDGQLEGVLGLAGAKPLTASDLAPIPSDSTIAVAMRLDADAVLETFLSVAGAIEPRAQREILGGLEDFKMQMGLDLRKDLLEPLGDSWCVYNSPSEGGLVITGLTAVVEVDDPERLAATQLTLVAMARAILGPDEGRRRGPRIEQFEFAGRKVYFFNAREMVFPLAPAWCLTDKELIVAPFPQNVKAYLSRDGEFESLATVPRVAELMAAENGPLAVSYVDVPKLFELIYPVVPIFVQMAAAELARQGIDVDVSLLPSAPSIGRHLGPNVSAVRRSPAGIESIGRQTLPGGSITATAPVAVALLLPAVQSARGAARRATSMNNMKQIGLAMHNHASAMKTFPAAYSTDAVGKPLLSWRVHVLPYIEQKALYDAFHLDEPWDSEHNKKLGETVVMVYRSPNSKAPPGMTNYLTVRGKDTAFPGAEKIGFRDIKDGTSNTIMLVEVSDTKAVPWTKPDDFEYDEQNPMAGLLGLQRGGFIALMCDGSVHFISAGIDPAVLKRLFTRSDGEEVDWRDLERGSRSGRQPRPLRRPPPRTPDTAVPDTFEGDASDSTVPEPLETPTR